MRKHRMGHVIKSVRARERGYRWRTPRHATRPMNANANTLTLTHTHCGGAAESTTPPAAMAAARLAVALYSYLVGAKNVETMRCSLHTSPPPPSYHNTRLSARTGAPTSSAPPLLPLAAEQRFNCKHDQGRAVGPCRAMP